MTPIYRLTDVELLRRLHAYANIFGFFPDLAQQGLDVPAHADERDVFLHLLTTSEEQYRWQGLTDSVEALLYQDNGKLRCESVRLYRAGDRVVLELDGTGETYPHRILDITPTQLLNIGITCISRAVNMQHRNDTNERDETNGGS